jgi:hypothetical protein
MSVHGIIAPGIGVQLVVILVVTIVPLVLFGCGLGLIPALILAYYIGRKEMTRAIAYQDITSCAVKGRSLSLACTGETPNKFNIRVATPDGERLYRELWKHYPQAVAQWGNLLHQPFSE